VYSPKILFPCCGGMIWWDVGNTFLRLEYSDWVLQRVKEIHHLVGVLCVGLEEQFMAILKIMRRVVFKRFQFPILNLAGKVIGS